MASAQIDWRGRTLLALIATAGVSAVLVCVTPAFAADPAPDPPGTDPAPTPDPAPAPPQPQPSSPEPTPTPSSSTTPSSTQTSGSAATSTAKPDGRQAKRKHRAVGLRRAKGEVPVRKWQRARNNAFAVALTLPAGAPEAEAVVARVALSPRSSSAPVLPVVLAAALAALLLAATPSYALNASRIFRPVEERRFELAAVGIGILVGIAVANGLPAG